MKRYLFISTLILFFVGAWLRLLYIQVPGFIFDTTVYYEWARLSNTQGFVWFWRDYTGWFDYLPAALFLFMFLDWFSRFFVESYISFVVVLKSLNFLFDILIVYLLYYIGIIYGSFKKETALFFASFVWALPGIWFVSGIWGQIDGLVVSLSLAGILLLYQSLHNSSRWLSFGSGSLLALAFWIKMQAILFSPLIVLFHLNHRRVSLLKNQIWGLIVTTAVIIAIPLLVYPPRLLASLTVMFQRADNMTVSANTFWYLIGLAKHTKYAVLSLGSTTLLTLEQLAYLIGLSVGVWLTLRFFGKVSVNNIWGYLQQRTFDLTTFLWMQTIVCVAYYAFFPKMYERYLYAGVVTVWFLFMSTKSVMLRITIFTAGVALNAAMFFNMLDVYVWWGYRDPSWILPIVHGFKGQIALLTAGLLMWGSVLLIAGYHLYTKHRDSKEVI